MIDRETCIESLLERLEDLIVDVEGWSQEDSDFTMLHELLVGAQDEAASLEET